MRYIAESTDKDDIKVVVLVKEKHLNKENVVRWYGERLVSQNTLKPKNIMYVGLPYDGDKAPIKNLVVPFLEDELYDLLDYYNNPDVFVADSVYFKKITGQSKFKILFGESFKSKEIDGTFYPIPNYAGYYYDENVITDIRHVIDSYVSGNAVTVNHEELRKKIHVLTSTAEIADCLDKLPTTEKVFVDIETFSLNFWEAGIATISFTLEDETTYSFACDAIAGKDGLCAYKPNPKVQRLLKKYFDKKPNVVFHNGIFDLKIITFVLYMKSKFFNWDGLKESILAFKGNYEDTALIYYLAHNSTTRITKKLKEICAKYLGNYGLDDDIKDITKVPLKDLLIYNAYDTIGTRYVYNEHRQKMIDDQQLSVYEDVFIPSVYKIVHMELVGIPLNINKVKKAKKYLTDIRNKAIATLNSTPLIAELTKVLRQQESDKKHKEWKQKTAPIEHFDYVKYNPNSDKQNQILLYDLMELPVVDKTKTGAPSTGKKTLDKLVNHTTDEQELLVLKSLKELSEVNILLDNFISTFLNKSIKKPDGWYYLHGSFNLGTVVSGRLSSSNPNLQNLPSSGNPHAKIVKACIEAPPGALVVGADFWSLEDRISALTTKDPAKLKVYTDGYDGHCLRAYSYFEEDMVDIDPNSVESINSIEYKYEAYRQDSKPPTFALTYQGTYLTLMNNLGWSEEKSRKIEQRFQSLYHVSIEWVDDQLKKASKTGYVECAFGLRLRTPALANSVYGQKMTYKAEKEKRTAGNALGQSYGLLNNRAGNELQERMFKTKDAHRYILPCADIHDAQYFIIHPNPRVIRWLNDNINECMAWQDLDAIRHPDVKLGGDLDIFYPDWSYHVTLAYKDTPEQIQAKLDKHKESINDKL